MLLGLILVLLLIVTIVELVMGFVRAARIAIPKIPLDPRWDADRVRTAMKIRSCLEVQSDLRDSNTWYEFIDKLNPVSATAWRHYEKFSEKGIRCLPFLSFMRQFNSAVDPGTLRRTYGMTRTFGPIAGSSLSPRGLKRLQAEWPETLEKYFGGKNE